MVVWRSSISFSSPRFVFFLCPERKSPSREGHSPSAVFLVSASFLGHHDRPPRQAASFEPGPPPNRSRGPPVTMIVGRALAFFVLPRRNTLRPYPPLLATRLLFVCCAQKQAQFTFCLFFSSMRPGATAWVRVPHDRLCCSTPFALGIRPFSVPLFHFVSTVHRPSKLVLGRSSTTIPLCPRDLF